MLVCNWHLTSATDIIRATSYSFVHLRLVPLKLTARRSLAELFCFSSTIHGIHVGKRSEHLLQQWRRRTLHSLQPWFIHWCLRLKLKIVRHLSISEVWMSESLGTLLVSWYLASNTLVALHPFSVAWVLVFPDFLGSECLTGTFDQTSYKHDAAADWNAWLSEAPLNFSAITGPSAPYHFRICRRCHLTTKTCVEGQVMKFIWAPSQPLPRPVTVLKAVNVPSGLSMIHFGSPYQEIFFPVSEIIIFNSTWTWRFSKGDAANSARKCFQKSDRYENKTILRPTVYFLTTRSNGTITVAIIVSGFFSDIFLLILCWSSYFQIGWGGS